MSPAEPKPPSSPASRGWYDSLVSGVGSLDGPPTGFDAGPVAARRFMGWRLRGLVLAVLAGCVAVVALFVALATSPWIPATWSTSDQGRVVLESTDAPGLKAYVGQTLSAAIGAEGRRIDLADASWMQRSPRWIVDPLERQRVIAVQREIELAAAQGRLQLVFGVGEPVLAVARERGLAGVGWLFWPIAALALAIGLVGFVVWLARPDTRSGIYLLLALGQAACLLYIAILSMPGLSAPSAVLGTDLPLRMGVDLLTAALAVNAFTLHPLRLAYGPLVTAVAWLSALAALAWLLMGSGSAAWWGAQGTVVLLAVTALLVLTRSISLNADPLAATMRRLASAITAALLLLLACMLVVQEHDLVRQRVAEIGSAAWTVLFAAVLLLIPMLTRSRRLLREFALLAGISTAATALDLVFVSIFSLGQFASVALAVFLSLGAYALARDWILNRLTGSQALTLDRIFDQLYRVGRAIEQEPEHRQERIEDFLRELFEPLEMRLVPRDIARSRVVTDGSALLVPAPRDGYTDFDGSASAQAHAWVLRHAHRGKRLFSAEDARLADRILQHLRRAVVYDRAVERGRAEERRRIAQDLHDDIGARLLTLMYKAQTPELEDYLRHTLQDLKTLTRGLAASEHPMSHAVAEWKSDIGQRLAAAQMTLHWSFTYDRDLPLSVIQWSALTRILRELVSNAIYHARASRLHIDGSLHAGRLLLWVADDGTGRDPSKWSHGLGLGGVRKRVRALGGVVRWRENQPRGIICEVQIDHLDQPPTHAPMARESETRR